MKSLRASDAFPIAMAGLRKKGRSTTRALMCMVKEVLAAAEV